MNSANNGHAPYDLLASGNKLTLYHGTWPINSPSAGLELVTSANVTVSANDFVQGDRGIAYQTSIGNSDNQACNIYALCNDFGAAQYSSFFVQDSANKLLNATNLYSRFSYNTDGCHIFLSLPASPTTKPTNFVKGIQFLNSAGSIVSPIFNPAVGSWTDSGNGYGTNSTGQYWINNPTNYVDGTFSFF